MTVNKMKTMAQFEQLDWDKQEGLLPAVVQNHLSGKVLMLGYMDKAALAKTLDTQTVTFTVAVNNVCGPKGKPQATR